MRIKWAPLNVSTERRLQTLAAASHVGVHLFGQAFCIFLIGVLLFLGHWSIKCVILAYLGFMYLDRKTADEGGRGAGCQTFRNLIFLKYLADYFPIDLVKTAELPPDRNYLFALFPHGIFSFGALCNFSTNNSKFAEYFPGIRAKMMTLPINFKIPIYRELIFAYGMGSTSENSISTLLNASCDPVHPKNLADGFTSNGVMIVVGGAQEAFYAEPKNYSVILKNRKGFVRMAIQSGVPLVPVISFNEVDVYDQVKIQPGTKLRRVQEWIKSITGVTPVPIVGRGFFQYTFGLIPQRKAITTVVGAPIEVTHCTVPSTEQIDQVHSQFCVALKLLFDTHKSKYIEEHETVNIVLE